MGPFNTGPGAAAPAGERCKWLQTEHEVYDTDADYFEEAADQAQAAGQPAGNVNALNAAARQSRNKANSLLNEWLRDCA